MGQLGLIKVKAHCYKETAYIIYMYTYNIYKIIVKENLIFYLNRTYKIDIEC